MKEELDLKVKINKNRKLMMFFLFVFIITIMYATVFDSCRLGILSLAIFLLLHELHLDNVKNELLGGR